MEVSTLRLARVYKLLITQFINLFMGIFSSSVDFNHLKCGVRNHNNLHGRHVYNYCEVKQTDR